MQQNDAARPAGHVATGRHPADAGRAEAGRQAGTRLAHRRDELAQPRRVRDRIDREYGQPLNVEALARDVHMSAGHLSRRFKLAYGESPYSYLMTRRIERAMALLRHGDLSVAAVSLGPFGTRFKELVGVSPGEYRRQPADATAGAAVRGEAGDQTGQEARIAGHRAGRSVTASTTANERTPMDITIHRCFLPHDDPDAALAFYRDNLGFEVRNDVGYQGRRWITPSIGTARGCSSRQRGRVRPAGTSPPPGPSGWGSATPESSR